MNKCALCNGKIEIAEKTLEFESITLGKIHIPNILVFECDKCHEQTLDIKQSDLLLKRVSALENEAIASLPINEFVSSKEAWECLGITRQAFNKDPKIKRGFIYAVKKGSLKLYHNKSVQDYKEKKDGRFPIYEKQEVESVSNDGVKVNIENVEPSLNAIFNGKESEYADAS